MRPKILITNDDGIHAPGIKVLWKALRTANFADLYLVAPSTERSGTGVSITWDRPILVQRVDGFEGDQAWAIDGSPADCVKMGERVVLKCKPDWIVSGINAGSNAGRNVLHSGTIGAVIEGALRGIPGIAFSCESIANPNYHVAEKYIAQITQYILAHPLPEGTILNVNFPQNIDDHVKGFRLTRQGKGRFAENPYLHIETAHGPSYWLGGKPDDLDEELDCDVHLLRQGYMTAVPLYVHELTDHPLLQQRRKEFETLFEISHGKCCH